MAERYNPFVPWGASWRGAVDGGDDPESMGYLLASRAMAASAAGGAPASYARAGHWHDQVARDAVSAALLRRMADSFILPFGEGRGSLFAAACGAEGDGGDGAEGDGGDGAASSEAAERAAAALFEAALRRGAPCVPPPVAPGFTPCADAIAAVARAGHSANVQDIIHGRLRFVPAFGLWGLVSGVPGLSFAVAAGREGDCVFNHAPDVVHSYDPDLDDGEIESLGDYISLRERKYGEDWSAPAPIPTLRRVALSANRNAVLCGFAGMVDHHQYFPSGVAANELGGLQFGGGVDGWSTGETLDGLVFHNTTPFCARLHLYAMKIEELAERCDLGWTAYIHSVDPDATPEHIERFKMERITGFSPMASIVEWVTSETYVLPDGLQWGWNTIDAKPFSFARIGHAWRPDATERSVDPDWAASGGEGAPSEHEEERTVRKTLRQAALEKFPEELATFPAYEHARVVASGFALTFATCFIEFLFDEPAAVVVNPDAPGAGEQPLVGLFASAEAAKPWFGDPDAQDSELLRGLRSRLEELGVVLPADGSGLTLMHVNLALRAVERLRDGELHELGTDPERAADRAAVRDKYRGILEELRALRGRILADIAARAKSDPQPPDTGNTENAPQ